MLLPPQLPDRFIALKKKKSSDPLHPAPPAPHLGLLGISTTTTLAHCPSHATMWSCSGPVGAVPPPPWTPALNRAGLAKGTLLEWPYGLMSLEPSSSSSSHLPPAPSL